MGRESGMNGGKDVITGFWWGNLRRREHLQDPDLDVILTLKLVLQTSKKMAWTELLRLMIRKSFGLLRTR